MKKLLFILSFILLSINSSFATESGVITIKSDYSVKQTLDTFEKILKSKGVTIFARIDHAKGAKSVNTNLRDTELLIFGNPKLGTPLLTSNQLVGLDLPLKALAWQDKKGNVWLSYNNPTYLAKRHNINDRNAVVNKIGNILKKLTSKATTR